MAEIKRGEAVRLYDGPQTFPAQASLLERGGREIESVVVLTNRQDARRLLALVCLHSFPLIDGYGFGLV